MASFCEAEIGIANILRKRNFDKYMGGKRNPQGTAESESTIFMAEIGNVRPSTCFSPCCFSPCEREYNECVRMIHLIYEEHPEIHRLSHNRRR